MPRLASGLAIRTRRPRPSDKSSPRALRGVPHKAFFLGWASPRRGGLRTPAREASLPPRERPIRPRGVRSPPVIMLCLGLSTSLPCGRGDRVPPRKSAFAPSPAPPRKAILACIAHRGGAGSARPRRIPRVELGNPHQTIGFWPIVAH